MARRDLIIAIDGPAGAGKTTTARGLAARLGYFFLDTGATFRALALKALRHGVDLGDPAALHDLAGRSDIGFGGDQNEKILLDGEDVSAEIRTAEVTAAASRIAAYPEVREPLMKLWRHLGRDGGIVLEGRDIGTVVFPDAELKVFLSADPSVRAERRYQEQASQPDLTPQQVDRQLRERDAVDRARRYAPLVKAPDAIEVDTTHLAVEETLDRLEQEARKRLAKQVRTRLDAPRKIE